ncbi:hypothetical protein FPANT_9466 [Fusarium pseudoanthophilum]|uniref:Uncharacterized protein n=1 Tax=Fusarium pseudoanthophilum TaxID=48495 RepID=A0A8H5NUR9_9HYPO|nr:hypothetical protein FPANT_9466 [Fusarium pseudoanthophilum]
MSSGVRFTSLPEPSEFGQIWDALEKLIERLKERLKLQDEKYSNLALDVLDGLESGIQGEERRAQLCKLRESWGHLKTLEHDLAFYLKQQRRLAEGSLSRIAEQLGTLNVNSMARAIQGSQMSQACYERPVEPLFDIIAESPKE